MTSDTATTPQQPIGSGFGAQSTAADVLQGIDLTGRRALVTGGYSGLGLETTRALVGAGASVVVPARRPDAARDAVGSLPGVTIDELDLADLDSVSAFVRRRMDEGLVLDIVIDNAGVMACPETRVGPGWELQFATNHLGHFALVNRLLPLLAQATNGARVISVSSRGHRRSPIRWDDMWFETGYDKWLAYGQAKTANVLFAFELDRRMRESGIRAFSLHPGGIITPLQRHLSTEEMQQAGWINERGEIIGTGFKTPEQGAATQTWAATSPQLANMGGVYCEDCEIAVVNDDPDGGSGVRSYAIDPEQATRLWARSTDLCGLGG